MLFIAPCVLFVVMLSINRSLIPSTGYLLEEFRGEIARKLENY